MKAEITYEGKSAFQATIRDHHFMMDTQIAAGGDNKGPSPKELLLASIIGCSGMDVAALLKKHSMTPDRLAIRGDAEPRKEHPRIFSSIQVVFDVSGLSVSKDVLLEAVSLSLTKFCGVSAMVFQASPIFYSVRLNGEDIGQGQANFSL